jgi:hypothetical protein
VRLDEALYSHLTGDAGIASLISTRCYPEALPPGVTFPAITYLQVSSVPIRTCGGRQGRTVRFQIDSWGSTAASARAVAEAVIDALDHYSGTMGGGVTIRAAFMVNDQQFPEPEAKLHRVSQDYEIWWQE